MTNSKIAEEFGDLVRQLRNTKGLSQEEFARLCGVHRTYVGSVERGEKIVTIETARKFAVALGVPLSEMFSTLEASEDAGG